MNTTEEITRLTEARNQYRWALANLTVAAVCVACAAFAFFKGHLVSGFIVVVVSFGAVINAKAHEDNAKAIRG